MLPGNYRWDGWMASMMQWIWVWVNSGSWWWTGRPGVLQSTGSQGVGHDWATELNWWLSGKESACSAGDTGLIARSGRSPCRRKWQLTPVFLPGKFYGQKRLADCSPRCRRRVGRNLATKPQQQMVWGGVYTWGVFFWQPQRYYGKTKVAEGEKSAFCFRIITFLQVLR